MSSRKRYTSTTPGWLMPHEAAEILSVSPKTVTRWCREGRLLSQLTLGGHRRLSEAEVRQVLADHTIPGDPFPNA